MASGCHSRQASFFRSPLRNDNRAAGWLDRRPSRQRSTESGSSAVFRKGKHRRSPATYAGEVDWRPGIVWSGSRDKRIRGI